MRNGKEKQRDRERERERERVKERENFGRHGLDRIKWFLRWIHRVRRPISVDIVAGVHVEQISLHRAQAFLVSVHEVGATRCGAACF